MRIGIGITTRNRNELLRRCVDNILLRTLSPHTLIIVDDASQEPVIEPRARVIRHAQQKGIACSKNDCLRALQDYDHVFLFDDDCWPIREGWETEYIRTSTLSGCHLMCYTWDVWNDSQRHTETLETVVIESEKLMLIDGKQLHLSDEDFSHPLDFRIRNGYGYGYQHTLHERTIAAIDFHNNGCGCMMYMDRLCVETIGGFYEGFPMYGGEHIDYFVRGFNAGLSPSKFVDIYNSELFFEALDHSDAQHRSTNHEPSDDASGNLLLERALSSEKVPLVV